jgi:CBS domain
MKVADTMTRGVISLAPEDSMHEAAKLMLQYEVSGFPVVDRGKLVGIITEADFLRRVEIATERHRARWIEILAGPERLAEEYVRAHGRYAPRSHRNSTDNPGRREPPSMSSSTAGSSIWRASSATSGSVRLSGSPLRTSPASNKSAIISSKLIRAQSSNRLSLIPTSQQLSTRHSP